MMWLYPTTFREWLRVILDLMISSVKSPRGNTPRRKDRP